MNNNLDKIVEYANLKQVVLSRDALLEMNETNYKNIINLADDEGLFVIEKKFVLDYLKNNPIKEQIINNNFPTSIIKSIKIPAADTEPNLIIPKNRQALENQTFKNDITDFDSYFKTRFKLLKQMLCNHVNIKPISSKALRFMNDGEQVCLVGIVNEKRTSKKGNSVFEMEDLDGEFKIIISQNSKLINIEKQIIKDDIIGVVGKNLGNKIIVAEEIEYPCLTNKPMNKSKEDLNLLITSDVHLGSNLFFENMFKNFINWINCRNVSLEEREEINKIKYMIFAGDNVDGVGIYPNQLEELNIIDIYEQYDKFYEYVSQIPEHIQILICPGNHDATRLADPQPKINKKFTKKLYGLKNVHMVGSPFTAIIEGVNTLTYHGNSMNTFQFQLKIDPKKPELAMEKYLERRCLAPIYGERHISIPDENQTMIIKEEPDIFITGHIHSNGYGKIQNTLTINPGCWQDQTSYQREQGHMPTPGRVPIVKLNKGAYFEKVFNNDSTTM